MSTNRKNRYEAVISNRAKNPCRRDLFDLDNKFNDKNLRMCVDELNEIIQRINRIVASRNIPYFRVDRSYNYNNVDKARVVIRSESSDEEKLLRIENEFKISLDNTFLVDVFIHNNGYIEIGCPLEARDLSRGFSGFLLIDRDFLSCALIDIFLDIAMFNSYSYLKELSVKNKREFNIKKIEFLESLYGGFTNYTAGFYKFNANASDYQYLSMAFFTRENEHQINYGKLIGLWNDFVKQEFEGYTHKEPPICQQLVHLVDYEQYTLKTLSECERLETGAWWLLRVIKSPIGTDDLVQKHLQVAMGNVSIGTEKIIRFDDLESIYDLVQEKYISAFKIIVNDV